MQHPIGDHALLADGRTAALVGPDGNVAWLCWPRIDSPPCLLSILDDTIGGCFTVAPAEPGAAVVERAYIAGTLVLRTLWRTAAGELTVHDFLSCTGPPTVVREVRARGSVPVAVRVVIAPDAARATPVPSSHGETVRIRGTGLDVAVRGPTTWTIDSAGVAECTFTLRDAEAWVVLGNASVAAATAPRLDDTVAWFAARVPSAATIAPNHLANAVLGADGARGLLRHSAAVLAGLHQRGGGVVAAPTTSLPQWPGSSRTWDYRYSWLRDTALAGLAMLRAGMADEAAGIAAFVGDAAATLPPAVLLRVDGTSPPPEQALHHLRGYRGSRPVRIGNAASGQPQPDVAGEVLEFAAALAARGALPAGLRDGVTRIADWTAEHWTQPDHGIWEIRGTARRYTHSQVMAWTGLGHACGLAEAGIVNGDAARWRGAAAAVRARVLRTPGVLTLHDDGGGPDAALAQAVLVGFFDADDPRADATLDSIVAELDRGGLIDRHVAAAGALADPCAPFLFPTFWVAAALEALGRDGSRHFNAAVDSRGALDLFGEVADPADHSPLGNYPQVQSHASFILAAVDV